MIIIFIAGGVMEVDILSQISSEIKMVVAMLTILSIVGSIGNGLVLYGIANIVKGKMHTFFIQTLACIDLLTCAITIPATIAMELKTFQVSFSPGCKVYHFLLSSTIPLSAFLMVAIAFERYFCICKNVSQKVLKSRAKVGIVGIAAVSVLIGVLCSLNYGTISFEISTDASHHATTAALQLDRNSTTTAEQPRNTTLSYKKVILCGLTTELGQYYYHATEKIYSSMFAICGLIVVFVYLRIYCFLVSRGDKVRKSAKKKQADTSLFQKKLQNGKRKKPWKKRLSFEMSALFRKRRQRSYRRYIKMAIVFAIVAFVFIAAFLPAWMMKLKVIEFNIFVFYLYFGYTVCNPFIYAFVNPEFLTKFREAARRLRYWLRSTSV
jgi:cholecystokinin A receptor/hypocretin (orexin) receptor 2